MNEQNSVFRQAGIGQDAGLQHFDVKKPANPREHPVKELVKYQARSQHTDDGREEINGAEGRFILNPAVQKERQHHADHQNQSQEHQRIDKSKQEGPAETGILHDGEIVAQSDKMKLLCDPVPVRHAVI